MTTAEKYRKQEALNADERHRPILEALKSGKTQAEVAKEFDLSAPRVNIIVKRARERGLLSDK